MSIKRDVFFDECITEIAKERVILNIGSGAPLQKHLKLVNEAVSFLMQKGKGRDRQVNS
jgi:hypothetical protein